MRVLVLGLFICIAANAVGQCPIQPRQASVDASGKNVTIRYYNSGVRLVRDVQFVLTTEDKEPSGQPVLTNFSARGVLRPKQERVALFPRRGGMGGWPTSSLISAFEVPRPCRVFLRQGGEFDFLSPQRPPPVLYRDHIPDSVSRAIDARTDAIFALRNKRQRRKYTGALLNIAGQAKRKVSVN